MVQDVPRNAGKAHIAQLIKQLSATPTIAAQGEQGPTDSQAALRANKEVFFFRLVRSPISVYKPLD